MPSRKDLTNIRFGRLVALYPTEEKSVSGVVWHCKCDCENEIDVPSNRLSQKITRSCGCLLKETTAIKGKNKAADLTKRKFGRLTALYPTSKRDSSFIVWHCECECGNEVDVSSRNLISENTISCGCYRVELGLEMVETFANYKKDAYIFDTRLDMIKSGRKPNKNSSTGHIGVYKRKKDGKYIATIRFQKKKYSLGSFFEIKDAIEARKMAEDKLYGDFLAWYAEFKKSKDSAP